MASWRALRYALLVLSPVSSHGICFGLGIAWAAALFSPFLMPWELPFRLIFLESDRDDAGPGEVEGEGDIFTMSARELGV
jgi:hypothetical protein